MTKIVLVSVLSLFIVFSQLNTYKERFKHYYLDDKRGLIGVNIIDKIR